MQPKLPFELRHKSSSAFISSLKTHIFHKNTITFIVRLSVTCHLLHHKYIRSMVFLLWLLLLLLSCMITYIHYCFIIIVITMLIMIVCYYVYKWLQQFLTPNRLRKGLVTVNVHLCIVHCFCALYLCVCVHVHCVVCFVSVCPTSCLAYCFGTCSMESSVFTYFCIDIYIYIYIYSSLSLLL